MQSRILRARNFNKDMKFEIKHTDPKTGARAGAITTGHGEIPTPIFMPVGTVGSVKGVHQRELSDDIGMTSIHFVFQAERPTRRVELKL